MSLALQEIIETIKMVQMENLDIRTLTMGINLHSCVDSNFLAMKQKVYDKITRSAERLAQVASQLEKEYGIPIINKRVAVSPVSSLLSSSSVEEAQDLAIILDLAAKEIGIDFIGGFSALVHKGITNGDEVLLSSLPSVLSKTERVCSSVSVATTKAGINMDAVYRMGYIIKETAEKTALQGGLGCAKLVVFCNPPEDNPFMAGAFHGAGEAEKVIHVGISGPGVVLNALKKWPDSDLTKIADVIKKTVFKITRAGQLIGKEAANRLSIPFGIVDLSLAPTNAHGDSVAEILEEMGLERCGTHGTTAALALLNDSVKKGGLMAADLAGGLSGAFIPVSEDNGMIRAVQDGALTLTKLEAMTCICSVGLDMIAIPGDTPAETIAGIIADESAIGMINRKTTAVRIIPVPGKVKGEMVEFGGLLGRAPVMEINHFSSEKFIKRGGRIPAPIQAFTN
ncbi:PFL family protein [Microaerobacter geothermalis]|uniref:PFL family protein n=1 Tax=Microaerobacter geothermalis TaxID=674972 RepID=UPI001F25EEB7|nr:PFL family protein [Microaerobacter geothermalis]MCF6095388.1 PFL family protein [Microaerobacter geothermalis]